MFDLFGVLVGIVEKPHVIVFDAVYHSAQSYSALAKTISFLMYGADLLALDQGTPPE